MKIARSPYRCSLLTGSCDTPDYYTKYPVKVVSFAMDQYAYIAARPTPSIFPYKGKLQYARLEEYNHRDEILHDGVRGAFEFLNDDGFYEIAHLADLPSRSGIGSSSAFCSALMCAMRHLRSESTSQLQIARDVTHVERVVLDEPGGCQDGYRSALGGFGVLQLSDRGIEPYPLSGDFIDHVVDRCVLLYLGKGRKSFEISRSYTQQQALDYRHKIAELGEIGCNAIAEENFESFCKAVDDSWLEKRKISNLISNDFVDKYYLDCKQSGALACRLLGAGGSGFLLAILPEGIPKDTFACGVDLHHIDIGLDQDGVKLL